MKGADRTALYFCSLAILAVILTTPVSGLLTLSIPDGDDTLTWSAEQDHLSKRFGSDPRLFWIELPTHIAFNAEVEVREVLGASPSHRYLPSFQQVTIRGPPAA